MFWFVLISFSGGVKYFSHPRFDMFSWRSKTFSHSVMKNFRQRVEYHIYVDNFIYSYTDTRNRVYEFSSDI